jgi:NAD kinase
MSRRTENKIILITRKTRLEELIGRFNTESQARFYIEHLGADFSDYKSEHDVYLDQVALAEEALRELGRLQRVNRAFVPNFLFGPHDVIVVIGQDGLVANVLKYTDAQPVVGVNPDPKRWEGALLPFSVRDIETVIPDVFRGARPIREVTMARAELNTRQTLYGVNDLFIGPRTHTSARYRVEIGGQAENHSSSGIIVSTGLGSTGWLRSIVTGAAGIASQLGGKAVTRPRNQRYPWDADYLIFSVREPWPSVNTSAAITFGRITPQAPLLITSHMPENGVVFSDGIEADYLPFNSGTTAQITVAEKKGRLVT